MHRRTTAVGITVISVLVGASSALATTYSWTMQPIGQAYSNGDMISLVMSRNQTWPSVFSSYSGNLQVSSSTPAGWMTGNLGSLEGGYDQPPLRTMARTDGQMAAIWRTSTGYTLAQSSRTGWQSTPFSVAYRSSNPDLAYTSANRPVVAYGNAGKINLSAFDSTNWASEEVTMYGVPTDASRISMDVDSLDRVGLAWSTGSGVDFAMKDPITGAWTPYVAPQGAQNPLHSLYSVQNISLAYGPNDETAMLISQNNVLTYAYFDIRSGQWKTETAASGVGSRFSELVFDNNGVPSFAYVDYTSSGNNLHYRRRVGFGWQDVVLPARAYYNAGVSLAFDFENLPVIAFRGDSNPYYGLTLAYDPIETPEPATLALLGLAVLFVRKRGN